MDTHTNTDTNNPINHTLSDEDLQIIKDEKILDLLDSLADDFFGDTPSEYLSNKQDLICIHNIYDDLQDNGYFNEEIIYYYNAIKYLKSKILNRRLKFDIQHSHKSVIPIDDDGYSNPPVTDFNTKNKKPPLSSVTVDIVQNLLIQVYTISPPTHSQFVNVSQRLICV